MPLQATITSTISNIYNNKADAYNCDLQTTLVPLDMWSEHAVWKQVFGKYETSLQKVQQYGELIKPSSAVVTYELQ